jgi:zinc protease
MAGCSADQGVTAIRSVPAAGVLPNADERVADDPLTQVSELDNGLTVYLRQNEQPGGQAEMRLVVNAGSARQSDDQSGVAHFLEHMLFNGTAKYPGNELIDTLRGFGMEFGADVNAYTSFDETVYSLTVPTDNPSNLIDGVGVLAQWLSAATLDPDEVIAERGVVLSEWRDRDQSFSGREFSAAEQMYLSVGSYAGRAPIGTEEAINSMTVEPLRRFYDDWYRPDNAAVVIVGDIDIDEVLDLVTEAFGDLAPRGDSPPLTELGVELADSPQATVVLDPDAQTGYGEIALPFAGSEQPGGTVGELRAGVLESLVYAMIGTRLTDDITRGEAPFVDAGISDNSFVRPLYAPYFYVSSPPDQLVASMDALAVELERAARYGFDESELDRARRGALAGVEASFDSSSSRGDSELADNAVQSFLLGTPNPSPRVQRDLFSAAYDSITLAEVSDAFESIWSNAVPYTFVSAPDSMTDAPTTESLVALLADVRTRDIEPREVVTDIVRELMEPPAPVVEESTTSLKNGPFLDPVQLTFPNGAIVVLNQTEIVKDSVSMAASSPGGISIVPDDKVWDAFASTTVMTTGGLGELDAVEVQQVLADSTAQVTPYIGDVDEGFTGSSSSDDLEQMFQIIHLLMTRPRADQVALDSWVSSVQPYVDDPTTDPDLAGNIALYQARYGDDVRYTQVPTAEQFAAVDLADVSAVFSERFSNASDWVFALSGDFSIKTATDFARRYIGSLPATGVVEQYVDRQADAPTDEVRVDVASGTGDKGSLTLLYTARSIDSKLDPIMSGLLEIIVTNRLTDQVREELGASYSPYASMRASVDPDLIVETYVSVSGDPQGLDELTTVVRQLIEEIGRGTFTSGESDDAQADLARQYDLYGNERLASALVAAAIEPRLYQQFLDAPGELAAISIEELRTFARRVLTGPAIEVRVTPG